MTIHKFYESIVDYQTEFFPEATINVIKRLSHYLKLTITLSENVFISIRFNVQNERQDFALIHKDKRIFGYDNLKRWHYHPFDNPAQHVLCQKPSIQKVFKDMKEIIEELGLRN